MRTTRESRNVRVTDANGDDVTDERQQQGWEALLQINGPSEATGLAAGDIVWEGRHAMFGVCPDGRTLLPVNPPSPGELIDAWLATS